MAKDLFSGFRSKQMMVSSIQAGGIYPVNSTTMTTNLAGITLGGNGTSTITMASPVTTTEQLTVDDIDVGRSLRMLLWFIEAYHPNVLEEFKAIEDIKK
jgi:hypothetical protein